MSSPLNASDMQMDDQRNQVQPGRRLRRKDLPATPGAYRLCDGATEGLLYLMVVFAPWAFGATQEWSICTLNSPASPRRHRHRGKAGSRPAVAVQLVAVAPDNAAGATVQPFALLA